MQALTPEQKKEQALAKKSEVKEKTPRKTRIPLGVPRMKLDATPIPGFHLHWINDYAGRVQEAQRGGYEFVHASETQLNDFVTPGNADVGSLVKKLVGKDDNGGALYAYLMKIDESLWLEDQKELQRKNEMVDESIRRGEISPLEQKYGSVKLS